MSYVNNNKLKIHPTGGVNMKKCCIEFWLSRPQGAYCILMRTLHAQPNISNPYGLVLNSRRQQSPTICRIEIGSPQIVINLQAMCFFEILSPQMFLADLGCLRFGLIQLFEVFLQKQDF